jgi:hypothetical protein
MDVCAQRPLMVTAGADRTVRIWHYLDKTCHLIKHFEEVRARAHAGAPKSATPLAAAGRRVVAVTAPSELAPV